MSYTDVVQGLIMFLALILVPTIGLFMVGGFDGAAESIRSVDPSHA